MTTGVEPDHEGISARLQPPESSPAPRPISATQSALQPCLPPPTRDDETRLGQLHVVQSPLGAPPYAEMLERALKVTLDDQLGVRVCSFEGLVAMKEASDRDQDRLDLKRLREARS